MTDRICECLENEVNRLFSLFQDELGIRDGGVDPLEAFELMEHTYLLADKINEILLKQKGRQND